MFNETCNAQILGLLHQYECQIVMGLISKNGGSVHRMLKILRGLGNETYRIDV